MGKKKIKEQLLTNTQLLHDSIETMMGRIKKIESVLTKHTEILAVDILSKKENIFEDWSINTGEDSKLIITHNLSSSIESEYLKLIDLLSVKQQKETKFQKSDIVEPNHVVIEILDPKLRKATLKKHLGEEGYWIPSTLLGLELRYTGIENNFDARLQFMEHKLRII